MALFQKHSDGWSGCLLILNTEYSSLEIVRRPPHIGRGSRSRRQTKRPLGLQQKGAPFLRAGWFAGGPFGLRRELDVGNGFEQRFFGDAFLRRVALLEKGLLHRFGALLATQVNLVGQSRQKGPVDAAGLKGRAVRLTRGGGANLLGFGQFLRL